MISWKAENPIRLLTELKNKYSTHYNVKDLRWCVEHNRCFVNQKRECFGSAAIKKGDQILFYPEKRPHFAKEAERILYEDKALLAYAKPPFLSSENLERLLGAHLVHRLDRDTSGVILLAKTQAAKQGLERQFRERSIQKEYYAIVEGFPGQEGVVQGKMALAHRREGAALWKMSTQGVWSQTEWRCLQQSKSRALLHCTPLTGRTHQIRVHLQHLGHPIVGDYAYGAEKIVEDVFRPLLHAYCVTFTHPVTRERVSVKAVPPADFNYLFVYPFT